MSVFSLFRCDGCNNEAVGDVFTRKFESLSGRGYGFGRYEYTDVRHTTPDGWVAFDFATGCTYCPDCLSAIGGDGGAGMNEHRSTITVYAGECMRAIDAIGGDPATVVELVKLARDLHECADNSVPAHDEDHDQCMDAEYWEERTRALLARIQPKEQNNG